MNVQIFDIRNYMWNVYEIYNYHKLDSLYKALDLFMTNVQLGMARYSGATGANYVDMQIKLHNTRKKKVLLQRKIFESCLLRNESKLKEAWESRNRELFEQVCLDDIIFFKL